MYFHGQSRNNLRPKKQHSDRKMTVSGYAVERVPYLKDERVYQESVGVIHNGKWDRDRVYNGDEVPLNMLSFCKQITGPNERVSIIKPPIVGHNKYRDGTLVPFLSGHILLFCVLILHGGSTVRTELRGYSGLFKKWLYITCNAKAYVDNKMWVEILKEFAYRTRDIRGTTFFGRTPQYDITLFTDNCSGHSTQSQKDRLIEREKIHERDLIPNATHIQQMVDQHVGVTIKNKAKKEYRRRCENIMDDIDSGAKPENFKVDSKGKRRMLVECVYEAVRDVGENHKGMIEKSWQNFGLDLPMDGSKDGDVNTLHRDGVSSRLEDIEVVDAQEEQKSEE